MPQLRTQADARTQLAPLTAALPASSRDFIGAPSSSSCLPACSRACARASASMRLLARAESLRIDSSCWDAHAHVCEAPEVLTALVLFLHTDDLGPIEAIDETHPVWQREPRRCHTPRGRGVWRHYLHLLNHSSDGSCTSPPPEVLWQQAAPPIGQPFVVLSANRFLELAHLDSSGAEKFPAACAAHDTHTQTTTRTHSS